MINTQNSPWMLFPCLQAGYEHYEICSYALPGHGCRHNRVYWQNKPYYAFGLGAASNLQHRRFARPRKMAAYRCAPMSPPHTAWSTILICSFAASVLVQAHPTCAHWICWRLHAKAVDRILDGPPSAPPSKCHATAIYGLWLLDELHEIPSSMRKNFRSETVLL